jgi:lysophospholipase L1-like esterase
LSYILFGDSVLDNETYLEQNEYSVQKWLEEITGELVFKQAMDGDVTEDVFSQMEEAILEVHQPIDDIILSAGGNDLLTLLSEAEDQNLSFSETVHKLYEFSSWFSKTYKELLVEIKQTYKKSNIHVCTVYKGSPDSYLFELGEILLPVFNEAISKTSIELGCRIINLNKELVDPDHFTSIIEPSNEGGKLIAQMIAGEL